MVFTPDVINEKQEQLQRLTNSKAEAERRISDAELTLKDKTERDGISALQKVLRNAKSQKAAAEKEIISIITGPEDMEQVEKEQAGPSKGPSQKRR